MKDILLDIGEWFRLVFEQIVALYRGWRFRFWFFFLKMAVVKLGWHVQVLEDYYDNYKIIISRR